MNSSAPAPRLITCPSCRAAVGSGSLVCGSCGGIIPIEHLSGRFFVRARSVIAAFDARHGNRATLLWTLALTPGLIAPPLVALVICMSEKTRRDSDAARGQTPDRTFIAVVAILNVLFSILLWRWLGGVALDFLQALWTWAKSHAPGAARARPGLPV